MNRTELSAAARRGVLLAAAAFVAVPAVVTAVPSVPVTAFAPLVVQAPLRKPVKTADDLPRRTYKIGDMKASDLIVSDAPFKELLEAFTRDAKADLAEYDITDAATLRGYYQVLQAASFLKGEYDEALRYSGLLRDIENNADEKLLVGVTQRAWLAAKKKAEPGTPAFGAAFEAELEPALRALPFDRIRLLLERRKNGLQMISRDLVIGSVKAQGDAAVAAMGGMVPAEVIGQFVTTRYTLDFALPIAPNVLAVYDRVLKGSAQATAAREDIWTPRLVTLNAADKAQTVVVGVWDSGVDSSLFAGRGAAWTNTKEVPGNGVDDDKNGFVDDVHGIAFDPYNRPMAGDLIDLAPLTQPKEKLVDFLTASFDMEAGLTTPATEAFKAYYKSLNADQIKAFGEDMARMGLWAHGTHVAGISTAGNPFAKVVYVRQEWETKTIPEITPTRDLYERAASTSIQAVDYMKAAGARVVNMSWRYGRSSVEGQLELKGVGKTPQERAALSREYFGLHRDALDQAFRSAPNTLFVAGAGNEDNDVDFAEYIPAGLRVPNLVTVGAVDEQGKPTSFTSFGKNVTLYADGYQVESDLPGGLRRKMSGTSMAAPQVSNLAAKLFAIDPSLTPQQVIELITQTGDDLAGYPGRKLINPKRAVETLRSRAAK
jgi:subtilisin family serine protease